jgi:transposase-like protein
MMGKKPSRSRYLQLCREECARWGVDYAPTIGNARWRPAAYVRSRVAKQLVAAGYGIAATARTMGMDHTTLIHSRRRPDEKETAYLERGPDAWTVAPYRDREKRSET